MDRVTLEYNVEMPRVRGMFEDCKKKFAEKYANEVVDVKKQFQKDFPEYKVVNTKEYPATDILLCLVQHGEYVYLTFDFEIKVDSIFIRIPRGTSMYMEDVKVNTETEIELVNPYRTYANESVSVCVVVKGKTTVISKEETAIKGVYDWFYYWFSETEENTVYRAPIVCRSGDTEDTHMF